MDTIQGLVDNKHYEDALEMINAELSKSPTDGALLLLRSTVLTRQEHFDLALKDAEDAARLTNGSPESQLRRAINLWRLSRHDEAQGLTQYFSNTHEAVTWKAIISKHKAASAVSVPRIPDANKEASPKATHTEKEALSKVARSTLQAPVPPVVKEPRLDWYQTPTTAHIMLYKKDLDPKASVQIQKKLLSIDTGDFKWSQVVNDIIPQDSRYEITAFKVEFNLRKAIKGNWASLTDQSDSKVFSNGGASTAPAKKPLQTTSTIQYDKWDSLDDSEPESNDPMDFFQKLYKGADDDTKRAMMKSYTESNGTALSTDWSEVSKGKVETSPPQDLTARK